MRQTIVIKGARAHNLKNIDIEIPRDKLIVFTGLSGSGKSSLAFDTIYAEGQRRYVESLSSYARQFLGQMEKPDVDYIDGLSPAISIDQKTTSRNPRSTVGTVTEIHDYLRLLYARIGTPHCPKCGREINQQTVDQMVDQITALPERTRLQILAPVVRARKGEHARVLESMRREGYVRARIDGEVYDLDDAPALDKKKKHTIEIVIDRLILRPDIKTRLTDSLETALRLGDGLVVVSVIDGEDMLFSQNYACPDCGISIGELEPRLFSFNNPYGACPACTGLGILHKIDPALVIPNRALSLNQGAVSISGWRSDDASSIAHSYFVAMADKYGFSMDTPLNQLDQSIIDKLLYGTGGEKLDVRYQRDGNWSVFSAPFEGLVVNLERRYNQTQSDAMKEEYEQYMSDTPCPDCHGLRLRREALAVTVGGISIAQLSDMSIREALAFLDSLELTPKQSMIAAQILKEIRQRLGFLRDVGLDYLTLSRAAATLSGGEAQRIRLATQIGSSLVGVLYILDEPSIGLHQRDNERLLNTLKNLRDLGNTLIVVEHDEDTMRAADWIVDIGPGAGENGGRLVAEGTCEDIMRNPNSITGQFLSGKRSIPVPAKRREPRGFLTIRGARANNLKNIDAAIPLGVFTCVTGVSGSGKSSLVNEILYKALARDLNRAHTRPGPHDGIDGLDQLDKIIAIDQSPIGRTPRSNPATYTGLFDLIRDVFAATPDAKARGYKSNRFSFNVKGGRCEACSGDGIIKIEMHFLPDIYVPCDVCGGHRYNRETLEVRYKGKNIYEVLDMTAETALEFFGNLPRLRAKLQTLVDVGLGYVKLGQPSTTLSGGEAQRIKLATELSRRATGKTLYVLDEPTTGLHMADVEKLERVLQQLTDAGNTVVVIEHNLDLIKTCDYIIDMGPEGGDGGGTIIASGTPEHICECAGSYTGQFLSRMLKR
ncbi:MAG TPA: excinuclease ABC subunit UvrA [Candidatus Fimadaptatus faecigallinarum]|uniref:UvrABC system protein A n=1 Tax=Candidatus Fimadaptatus faecigallinarum TaxID=2840814 RepID=A0A9D1S4T1_9FIRM|nr:excinuclease ABC subunit UvrA [Candidatus Fimadaptatus faecigallinarum]